MGNVQNRKIRELIENIGLEKIEHGLNSEEAKKMFRQYDTNGDGELDEKEAKQLFKDIIEISIRRMEDQVDILKRYRHDNKWIGDLLKAFDENGDGTVEEQEFINTIVHGTAELGQPQRKKAKVDEK